MTLEPPDGAHGCKEISRHRLHVRQPVPADAQGGPVEMGERFPHLLVRLELHRRRWPGGRFACKYPLDFSETPLDFSTEGRQIGNQVHEIKILQLIDEGIAISRVKEALDIAREDNVADEDDSNHWNRYQDEMLRGVNNFDENLLDSVYNEAMSLYPVDAVTKQLLLPLLAKLGQRWMHVSTGVAEEHFFSVFMRNKLGARFHHQNRKNQGPRLLAACLPDEQHEFGLMLFTLAAHARGYRIVLLGADMPIQQLAEVVHRSNSDGVVLSGSVKTDPDQLHEHIKTLIQDSSVPVWVGGNTSETFKQEIESAGAVSLGSDLIVGLHLIHKILPVNQ